MPTSYSLTFQASIDAGLPAPGDSPYMVWDRPGGGPSIEFYRDDNGYLIRFPELADFEIRGHAVTCHMTSEAMKDTCTRLYHNQITPLLRSLDGSLILHASAVAIGTRAILLLGRSGSGKSTLATRFASLGNTLICDDTAVIGPSEHDETALLVEPGHQYVRLWSDSAHAVLGASRRVPATRHAPDSKLIHEDLNFGDTSLPIAAVYHLAPPDGAAIRADNLPPPEAFRAMTEHQFILDDRDRNGMTQRFDRLTQLAGDIPHFLLTYPRDYACLKDVQAFVSAHNSSKET